jgi:hypothetical protein
MDFIEGLPMSDSYNLILVVVDRFTEYSHFVSMCHPFTAPQVARIFANSVVKLHGMPHSITSDRDKIFTSNFWKLLFHSLGTKLKFITAYQCLEMFLRCMVHENPKQWHRWLPEAEFWYNSTYHSSLECTPFKVLYGHESNLGALPAVEETSPVAGVLTERATQIELLKHHLTAAQNRIKIHADRSASALTTLSRSATRCT